MPDLDITLSLAQHIKYLSICGNNVNYPDKHFKPTPRDRVGTFRVGISRCILDLEVGNLNQEECTCIVYRDGIKVFEKTESPDHRGLIHFNGTV